MFLDSKLNFSGHLKTIFQKPNKIIGLLCKLQTLLPRAPLITIFKPFIRPHLDYGDMIYDQTFNMSFQQKMETIQYNAALAITGAIRGSSRHGPQMMTLRIIQISIYQTLVVWQKRGWHSNVCKESYKIQNNKRPSCF